MSYQENDDNITLYKKLLSYLIIDVSITFAKIIHNY